MKSIPFTDERRDCPTTVQSSLTEFEGFFIANKNRVIQKNALVEHLWEIVWTILIFLTSSTITKNLKKLLAAHCNDYIQSIYGIGYTFKTEL
jgi:DNA-binding response OmpR family regulator